MDQAAQEIRLAVEAHLAGRSGRGLRYPMDLRVQATAYVRRQVSRGESLSTLAERLGIGAVTLERWLRHERTKPAALRRVEIVAPESAPATPCAPALVTPTGYRIEGLNLSDLLQLLRAVS